MGETDLHRDMMVNLIEALREYYRPRPDVYVSGNILFYYERGNPQEVLSPDVLVTLGIPKHRREIYKLWEEGKPPDLVIEVTSRTTRLRDVGKKKGLYEHLGVAEYILFDPRAEYLMPRFQVYRLENGSYLPVLVPEEQGYASERLGLCFKVEGGELRIYEAATGRRLRTPAEQAQWAEQESLRAEQESLRAEQESRRAEQESRRAEQESSRAERLAARLRELGLDPDSL